jgi:penicillin amidase
VNLTRLLLRLLGRRLPRTSGRLTVVGIGGPVRIHRDRWGIPYIEAQSVEDACFGIGFCQGQDRTFQLEILLRVARGTLAEVVGPTGLPIDRLARRIGFRESSLRQWPVLAADMRRQLEAFAAGIRAGATTGLRRRPHEFVLLGTRPTPWEATDTLGVVRLISFTLASNWDVELARLHILTKDGPEALAALDPAYPEWLPVTAPPSQVAGPAQDRLAEDLAALRAAAGSGGGSNSWVVAGSRTATGRPLLANDPHLNAALPPHWYLLQARAPGWAVAGACFVGGPAVLSGHNGQAAWGVTAALVDNTDLFMEEIGSDGASVRQGDGFVGCPVRDEVIRVKGGSDVKERVLVTPRGPIVTPSLDGPGPALSLRASWLDPLPAAGLFRLAWLCSFDQLHRDLGPWPATAQNVVYAEAGGTVGWKIVGQAPRRRQGAGTLPAPGWDPAAGWEDDPVAHEEMPHAVDPPVGFIATANNRPLPDCHGPYLGCDFLDGYRVAAIARSLAVRNDWDVASTQRLQLDQQALAWEDVRDAVLAAPAADAGARQALGLLRDWDGRVTVDSSAAAVYELFLAGMAGRLARARAPRSAGYALGCGLNPVTAFNFFCYRRTGHLARLLRAQPAGWFARPWPQEVADALAAAVRQLRGRAGDDVRAWSWGRVRPLTLHHPLGRRRRLAGVFNLGPVPYGGDADTINQGAALPLDPLANVDNIASVRVVIDVGNWSASRFALPGGQSGNPFSPHYADLFPLWLRGEGVPIAWTADEIRAATRGTLELVRSG